MDLATDVAAVGGISGKDLGSIAVTRRREDDVSVIQRFMLEERFNKTNDVRSHLNAQHPQRNGIRQR